MTPTPADVERDEWPTVCYLPICKTCGQTEANHDLQHDEVLCREFVPIEG